MTLISVEGIDGTGKSTLVAALAAALSERGVDVLTLREPGGVALSERIRGLVSDPGLEVSDRAEALLYAAARAELVSQRLSPALSRGQTVLLDRYVDSSLAYQGGGRGLGVEAIAAINAFATGGLTPDRTLWLALDPVLAAARAAGRTRSSGVGPDRIEQAGADFFTRAHASYAALAQADPERIRVLDAAASPEDVLAAALAALADLVG